MNPNSPLSYYQIGSVTVVNGSKTVSGYKTQWVSTQLDSKPKIGSTFTIDKANFYLVEAINDDNTITLNKEYRGPNNAGTSYLLINQLDIDFTDDDKITAEDIIDAANEAADNARDWAIKMDGPIEPTTERSSKYHATESAKSAEYAEADRRIAEGAATNAAESEENAEEYKNQSANSASAAAQSETNAAKDAFQVSSDKENVEEKASEVEANASQVASDKQEVGKNAKYVHDLTIGPNPPSHLETPSDTNNAYYYFQQVLNLTSGAISFNNKFTPSAEKEYPEKTPTSGLWLIETTDLEEGYTFSTGNMSGYSCYTGDWFVYYKDIDVFEVMFVSPLHNQSIPLTNENRAGIAEIATQDEVDLGLDDQRIVTPIKLAKNNKKNEWKSFVQTESNLLAMRALASNEFAASGFVHYGKHVADTASFTPINEGMFTNDGAEFYSQAGQLLMGELSENKIGSSKTDFPVTHIAGFVSKLLGATTAQGANSFAIKFPEALDGTVTYNAATGEVIKHADTTTAFALADTSTDIEVVTNRVDMFGFEFFLEEVEEVFPYGCIQSQEPTIDGIPTKPSTRPASYFAVYEGDVNSVGNCVVWSELTDAQKVTVSSNIDHNLFLLDDGRLVQWRMRQRTVAGVGNGDWYNLNPNITGNGYLGYSGYARIKGQGFQDEANAPSGSSIYDFRTTYAGDNFNQNIGVFAVNQAGADDRGVNGECYFLVCGVVPRLNQGAYHPSLNPMGAAKATDGFWYESALLTDTTSCFTNAVGGNIGSVSGRPDGKFYDAIYASGQGGVIDYRLSAWDMSSKEEASKIFQKVVNGSYRGEDALIKSIINNATLIQNSFDATILGKPARIYRTSVTIAESGMLNPSSNTAINGIKRCAMQFNGVTYIGGIHSGNGINLDFCWFEEDGVNPPVASGNAITVLFTGEINTTVSGEFTQVDVIGDPANILATPALANDWLGSWIPEIPKGTSQAYQLARKIGTSGDTFTASYTTNNGTSWASQPLVVNGATNAVTANWDSSHVWVVPYTAFAKQTKSSSNKKVLNGDAGLGNVWSGMSNEVQFGNALQESLLGKVGTAALGNTAESNNLKLNSWIMHSRSGKIEGNINDLPRHNPVNLLAPNNDSPAVKALWYQTSDNSQLGLNFAWNELVYNSGGTVGNEWGDTIAATTYTNASGQIRITDGTSTFTNLNGDTCLYGTNELSIPYGYSKNIARAGEQISGIDVMTGVIKSKWLMR
ncbi:hypothetical protein [Vibrio parahaemolyticus]|uniref:hypothetical protein n=1 Tax=Vibrio parahaemolyticus TaxID=670 RepID=UPI00387B9B18